MPPSSNADRLYRPLLVVIVSLIGFLSWRQWQLSLLTPDSSWGNWLYADPLAMVLMASVLAVLAWQIWFARQYRPYPRLEPADLPRVTVIIPAYNEGRQVLATVQSVMACDYPRRLLQVICIDDGSQDDTWTWILKARAEFHSRVKIIRQARNQGKRAALMAGFSQAKGEIVVTLDSDSVLDRDALQNLVSPFVLDSRVGSVAGNVRVLNLDEGAIPRMMEVSFVCSFDFIRAGQSVYGGVFCTPGALSAYRLHALKPMLAEWSSQTFLGKPATIGEDRALTNLMLANGHRVVYQRNALVFTNVPKGFSGLRKMLMRWMRSNVRENLVMLTFIFRPFRAGDTGTKWVRLFASLQIFRMSLIEALKCAILVRLLLSPGLVIIGLFGGAIVAAIVPATVHRLRYGGLFGVTWALPFSFYWLVCLSWISLWGTFTAANPGWLTREIVTKKPLQGLNPLTGKAWPASL